MSDRPSMERAGLTVLKLGGELLENAASMPALARAVTALGAAPLVVIHGGGREIDAEAARRGIEKRSIEGLRITDEPTLSVAIAVLAGLVNTRLVAAIVAAGGRAVGLTGADAALGLVEPAPPHRTVDGRLVELGLVGRCVADHRPELLADLCTAGYLPVVASIGVDRSGRLFNVNADTFAAHVAVALGARRLLIGGATAGVLDGAGRTIAQLDSASARQLMADGRAHAGMVAKLAAGESALEGGVEEVWILDGREPENFAAPAGTVLVRTCAKPQAGASV